MAEVEGEEEDEAVEVEVGEEVQAEVEERDPGNQDTKLLPDPCQEGNLCEDHHLQEEEDHLQEEGHLHEEEGRLHEDCHPHHPL